MVVRRKTIMSWVLALHSVVAHGEILHLASFEPEVHVYVYIMYMNINSRIASSEVVIPEKRLFWEEHGLLSSVCMANVVCMIESQKEFLLLTWAHAMVSSVCNVYQNVVYMWWVHDDILGEKIAWKGICSAIITVKCMPNVVCIYTSLWYSGEEDCLKRAYTEILSV